MQASDLIPPDAPPRVRAAQLAEWFGVSVNAIQDWVEAGRLPAPLKLGPRTHWYDVEEVRAALKATDAAGGPGKRRKVVK